MRNFITLFVMLAFVGCASPAQKAFKKGTDAYWDRNYPAAIESMEKAIELEPTIAHYHSWLAVTYYGNGELDKAQEAALRAIEYQNKILNKDSKYVTVEPGSKLAAESAGVYVDAGCVLLKTGGDPRCFDIAFSALETATLYAPKDEFCWWYYCLALEKKGDIVKAFDAAKKAQKYIEKDGWDVTKEKIRAKVSELESRIFNN